MTSERFDTPHCASSRPPFPALRATLLAAAIGCAAGGALAQTAPAPAPADPKIALQAASGGEPVAIVEGVAIPASDLERALRQQAALGRQDTPELRARLREDLIARELLYQEAVRRQLDRNPAFVAALESARKEALGGVLLQTVQPPPISDEQVRQAYDRAAAGRHPEDFRLRAIVVVDEARARQVRSALARGGAFEELAAQHSTLPSARNGGDLGWLNVRAESSERSGPLPAPVAAAARGLSKGGFSAPVADGQGRWWLVRLEESRPATVAPFEKVAPQLRASLETTARAGAARSLVTQLRQGAKVGP